MTAPLALFLVVGCGADNPDPSGAAPPSVEGAPSVDDAPAAPSTPPTSTSPTASDPELPQTPGTPTLPPIGDTEVDETVCANPGLAPARIRKITDRHYQNLIVDLVPGVTPGAVVTEGEAIAPIADSDDSDFIVRENLALQYWNSAESVAAQVAENVSQYVPCAAAAPDAASEMQCATQFVDAFAPRAFRAPLEPPEREALLALYSVGAEDSFVRGIELVVKGVLQSPRFLYRTELGPPSTPGDVPAPGSAATEVLLSPFEVASSLSFMFLESGPDDELWAAALDGSLATSAGLDAQLERLVALPEARARGTQLFLKVLGADQAITAPRNADEFPELTPELRATVDAEVRQLVDSNVWSTGTFSELFLSRSAAMDPKLAELYGITGVTAAGMVELPEAQRAGILTRIGTLLGMPPGSRSVQRGLFMVKHYLCQNVPNPPPAIQDEIEDTLEEDLTERQLSELRASKPVCTSCHAQIDPLGLAFENFDLLGRWVTERDGLPADASGVLTGTDVDGPFQTANELSQKLAQSGQVATCVSKQLTSQAIGRNLRGPETCSVKQFMAPWQARGGTLKELLPMIAKSRVFLYREKGSQP